MTSAQKETRYGKIKSLYLFRKTFPDESLTIRPGSCINKINRVNFDFMLTASVDFTVNKITRLEKHCPHEDRAGII